jgi:cation transport regulator ChaB
MSTFREATNSACAARGREDIAHRIAWVAAKRQYHKVDNEWVPLGE